SPLHSSLRRPQPPTLFPYTTLFRSEPVQVSGLGDERRLGPAAEDRGADPSRLQILEIGQDRVRDPRPHQLHRATVDLQATQEGQDRKSTRLNSSHVKISYAVFCLKN